MNPNKEKTNARIRAAVLIASDRAATGARPDETRALLSRPLEDIGVDVVAEDTVPDDRNAIAARLRDWSRTGIDLILVSGGTGVSPTDVTPEATLDVIDKRVPGIEEAMRRAGGNQGTAAALLGISRPALNRRLARMREE